MIIQIKHSFLIGFFIGALIFILPHSDAYARLNKWVDDKGQIHYGDRVPSQYLSKEHSQLNEQGVTLRTSKALKTKKEMSALELQRRIEADENKKRLIAARKKSLRDRVLLDTFTTEKDLIIAREARVDAIDSQISLAETLIKHDEVRLTNAKKHISDIEKNGRKAPENRHKEVVSVSRQLENNYAYIEDKTNERSKILSLFKKDVLRFRVLMKLKHEARERRAQESMH